MMEVILFIIVSSVERSNEEVASSKMYKEGRFNKTLAMAILCFSPPESFSPLLQPYHNDEGALAEQIQAGQVQ